MSPSLNGHSPDEAHSAEITAEVAQTVYESMAEEGDDAWLDLTADERHLLAQHAQIYIMAHIVGMQRRGMRLLPPGAMPRPHSEAEAMAMIQAAKDWFEARGRKKGLVGSVLPKKLILPPGVN